MYGVYKHIDWNQITNLVGLLLWNYKCRGYPVFADNIGGPQLARILGQRKGCASWIRASEIFGLQEFPPVVRTMHILLARISFSSTYHVKLFSLHEIPSVAHTMYIYVHGTIVVRKEICARQMVVLKEIGTIFERASEIFSCKPNRYGFFWKIVLVEFVLVEFVQAEDPLYCTEVSCFKSWQN